MNKSKLLFKYSKLFGKINFLIIIQYILVLLILSMFLPPFRVSYQNYLSTFKYPMNKLVYYQNAESIYNNNMDEMINKEELIKNDKKFLSIISKYKDIKAYSPLTRIYTSIEQDNGRRIYYDIVDPVSFQNMVGKDISKYSGKYIGLINRNSYTKNNYKPVSSYPFNLDVNGETVKLDILIIGYIEKDNFTMKPDIITNGDIGLEELNSPIFIQDDIEKVYLMDNDLIRKYDTYDNENLYGFQRLVYFDKSTNQATINNFIAEVKNNDIGYINSNENLAQTQKDKLMNGINSKVDRVLALTVLMIFSLFSVLKVSHNKIYSFISTLHILGYEKKKSYLLNFLYNTFLFLVALIIVGSIKSYIHGGFVARLFDPTATYDTMYILTNIEYTVTFIFFLSSNLLLTL